MRWILWGSPSFAYSTIPLLNKLISVCIVCVMSWSLCHHTWWQIPSFTMCMQSRAGRLQAQATTGRTGFPNHCLSLPLLHNLFSTTLFIHFVLFNSFPSLLLLFAQIPDMFYCCSLHSLHSSTVTLNTPFLPSQNKLLWSSAFPCFPPSISLYVL